MQMLFWELFWHRESKNSPLLLTIRRQAAKHVQTRFLQLCRLLTVNWTRFEGTSFSPFYSGDGRTEGQDRTGQRLCIKVQIWG